MSKQNSVPQNVDKDEQGRSWACRAWTLLDGAYLFLAGRRGLGLATALGLVLNPAAFKLGFGTGGSFVAESYRLGGVAFASFITSGFLALCAHFLRGMVLTLAEALGRVLTDGGLRRALATAGRTDAARFHPDRGQAPINTLCTGILGS